MPHLRPAIRICLTVALFFALVFAGTAALGRLAQAAPAQPAAWPFGANLVANGNAEAGPGYNDGRIVSSIPGWPNPASMSVVLYSAVPTQLDPYHTIVIPPNHGLNFFAGLLGTPRPYIEQDIDLRAAAAVLDGGQAVATFSLYLGGAGTNPDRATATVIFLDGNKVAIGAGLTIDPISRSAGRVGVWRKSVDGAVPSGTRWARVRVGIPGTPVNYAPWFADNISLVLSQAATGRPGTFQIYLPALMGGSSAPAPKPTPVPPAAPTNLRATAASPESILLQWDDKSNNEAGFQIERQSGAIWNLVGTAVANQTSYTDHGLTPAMTYSYRVRATGATGPSSYSNIATATTLPPPPLALPAPPTNLQAANTTSTSTYLTWQDNANNEAGFKLEMLLYPGDFQEIGAGSLGANATGIQVVDLPPGAEMLFRITAYNAAGNSGSPADNSNVVRVKTPAQTAGAAILRFQNNSSHPIIYLTVDGQQQFPASPYGILPGNYYDLEVNAGPHNFEARNGFWQDNGTRFEMWVWNGTATATAGSTVALSFEDPSIQQQLTDFGPSGVWAGWYFDAAANYHEAWFCFYANGRFRYYNNGNQTATGSYDSYVPGPLYDGFSVHYDGGKSYGAMYYPALGQFDMSNGAPGDLFVEYVRRLGQTCTEPAP
ncbi:MAG TPA: fibronectin type III domain-containing protein [Anaerolineae bacterium]